MNIRFWKVEQKEVANTDDDRPVKMIPEGSNSWRIVYADSEPDDLH